MDNVLISRSEAEKLGATCLARRNENGQLEAIISLDNAPTVKPRIEYGTDRQPYKLSMTNGKEFERPQVEKKPVFKSVPTYRKYEDYHDAEQYVRGWNDAMRFIFGIEER